MENEKARTVFVGNLTDRVTEPLLYELFLQAGPLEKVKLATDKDGRSKRFAFVTFKHECSVPYTIELLNGIRLFNSPLRLQTRTGSDNSGPYGSPYGSPMHPGSSGNTPPGMQRSHTWHGNENPGNRQGSTRHGQNDNIHGPNDNSSMSLNAANLPNMMPQNMDSFSVRRDRVLQQQQFVIQMQAQRQLQQMQQYHNPYGQQGNRPWQPKQHYRRH